MRSLRLSQQLDEKLIFYPSTAVAEIQKVLAAEEFAFVIIDSIQTAHSRNHSSGPGSVAQVRESAYELRNFLEGKETVLLFIAHVTKEGSIAGPKLLEHLVDAVFYFEGERFRDLRLIRAFKNRFGQVNDIAIFQMTAEGLVEIQDPTGHFLEDEEGEEHPGIAISAVREGSLILVVEIQALASEILYQAPKRATDGLDLNRLQLLAAVLDKYAGMALRNYDLFVKIAGGVMVSDPAVDLALLLALASSFYNRPVTDSTLFVGEVSLSGQIRPVNMIQERMQAAQSMGFRRVMLPDKQKLEAKDYPSKIIRVGDVTQALATVF
jgi:DNA repair protein RadA/Sms